MKAYLTLIIFCFLYLYTLTARDFKGGELRTKVAYTYGRFEVKYKSTFREGVLATFFTYYDGGGGIQNWNEIDIEIMGRYDNDVQFNTITPNQQNHVRHQFVNFNPHLDFHLYAFEWTPDYVAWFINGEEVHRQTGDHIQTLTRAQKIMMNIWNPVYDNWAGDWNPEVLPAFAYYDFVSYYSYTPGSGSYGIDNNFTHQWTDNFDIWDQNRWSKATHTFDGNNCDFLPDNVVFKDSMMILCLTDNANTGYTDKKAPVLLASYSMENKVTAYFSEELDKTSAETKSNFLIAGVTIDSVILLENKKDVQLSVTGISPSVSYNLIALNIKDDAETPNTMSAKAVTINKPDTIIFPIKINVGGSAYLNYLPDNEWNNAEDYGFMDGSMSQSASSINNTEDDIIFQSDRYGIVTYKVRLPNGNYNIKLLFCENYFSEPDKRIFDIYVENNNIINNIDIFQMVGKNSALEIPLNNIEISDKILDINFSAEIDNPLINGIIIENIPTGINDKSEGIIDKFLLEQNYPNPFNSATKIKYYLSSQENLVFEIHDLLGQKVYSKNLGVKNAGSYELTWNGINNKNINLSSGIYIYSINGNNITISKKLVLLN